jgi:hypothetical protein
MIGRPDATLCPSAMASPEASVIGLIDDSGRVVNFATPLQATEQFLKEARQNGPLEKRFRFSSDCKEAHCIHWNQAKCGLIPKLQVEAKTSTSIDEQRASYKRPCSIRANCRWWRQEGYEACAVCLIVVTDQSPLGGPVSNPVG